MPTLYSRSTSIQLSVANIAKAITPNPLPRQCPESTRNIEQIDLEFAKASNDGTLAETVLKGDDGRHLRFLGKHQDMQFVMVRAGREFYNPNATENTTIRPARSAKIQMSDSHALYDSGVDETEANAPVTKIGKQGRHPIEAHALCLTVFLSRGAFSQTTYTNRTKVEVKHDLRIDVYFNGQFMDSQITGHGHLQKRGRRGIKVRMQRFTGLRIGRYVEKPWTFVPPDVISPTIYSTKGSDQESLKVNTRTNRSASFPVNALISERPQADIGASRRNSSQVPAPCPQNLKNADEDRRWNFVANRLLDEADRVGRDRNGDKTVTADYLESLATLPAPPELKDTQNTGNANFGVIDVVVIWGEGRKDGPNTKLMTQPTRFRLDQRPTDGIDAPHSPNPTPKPNPAPQTRTEALATALTLDDRVDEPSTAVHPTLKQLHSPQGWPRATTSTHTPQPSTAPSTTDPSTRQQTPKRSREPSISSATTLPTKRQKRHYQYTTTAKTTLEQEMDSIVERAQVAAKMWSSRAMSSPLSSAPEDEEVSLVEEPKPSKLITLKVSPKQLASSPIYEGLGSADGFVTPRLEGLVPSDVVDTGSRTAIISTPGGEGSTMISASGGAIPVGSLPIPAIKHSAEMIPKASVHSLDAHFVPPELSEDCCVTFAKPGIVRSIGAVRGGWFKEKGVIMGTRFIVG